MAGDHRAGGPLERPVGGRRDHVAGEEVAHQPLARVRVGAHRAAEVALRDDAGIARVDVDHGQRGDAAVQHGAGRLLERLVGRDRDHALAQRMCHRQLTKLRGEVHSQNVPAYGPEVKRTSRVASGLLPSLARPCRPLPTRLTTAGCSKTCLWRGDEVARGQGEPLDPGARAARDRAADRLRADARGREVRPPRLARSRRRTSSRRSTTASCAMTPPAALARAATASCSPRAMRRRSSTRRWPATATSRTRT